jgi:hypothetical protein
MRSRDFALGCHEVATRINELPESGSVAASGEMMLLDAIALLILMGMMFIPLVNIIVGVVVGAGLAGPPGALFGLLSALAISAAQKIIGDRRGWGAFGQAEGSESS